jgi:hypothetical protein
LTHTAQTTNRSLDHLVGAQEERGRDRHSDRARCLQVYGQLELARLLDRQISRLCAAQNLVVARKDSAILLLGPNVLSVSVDSNLRSFPSEVENHVEECDMRAYAFGLATACFDGMDQKSSWPGLSRPSTPWLPGKRRGCAGQARA